MGRYYSLTLEASSIPSRERTKTKTPSKTNWNFWILGCLGLLSVVYLLQVNGLSTKGYEIKKLERKIVELEEIQKKLDLESAALQSIQQIEESVKVLNLVPSEGINYPSGNGYAYEDIVKQ